MRTVVFFSLIAILALTDAPRAQLMTPLGQRHWRDRALAPELPHPEITHPGIRTERRPRARWRRRSLSPALPHPELLHPQDTTPLASGFVMTVTKPENEKSANGAGRDVTVRRPRDVAERLAACWDPPPANSSEAREVTLRMQFSAKGSVIGQPKVSFVQAGDDANSRNALVKSIQTAVADCTPLRFTGSMGPGIAGYPFAIRFVAAGADN